MSKQTNEIKTLPDIQILDKGSSPILQLLLYFLFLRDEGVVAVGPD